MTFQRRCDDEQPHPEHRYEYHWIKKELFYLPSYMANHLPDEWDVTYNCKGVEQQVCSQCSAELDIDTRMTGRTALFCPNSACDAFVQSFWVEK